MKIAVIGAGASGLMISLLLRRDHHEVVLIERNQRLGKKLMATGNGRCNITNRNLTPDRFHGQNPSFALSALHQLDFDQTMDLFTTLGIWSVELEKGKVYPASLEAKSVVQAFENELVALKTDIRTDTFTKSIVKQKDLFNIHTNHGMIIADRVVLATGGSVLKTSGSDGNGYRLAASFGHTITAIRPGIVQLRLKEEQLKKIKGVRLNAHVRAEADQKTFFETRDDIIFTDYGISGTAILEGSRVILDRIEQKKKVVLKIDLFPDWSREELETKLYITVGTLGKRTVEDLLIGLIANKLIAFVLRKASIDKDRQADSLDHACIQRLVATLKGLPLEVDGPYSLDTGQVTAGGVSTDEVDPKTMESRLVDHLYMIGELLDIDGDCGGFNLQWAWSSAYACAKAINKRNHTDRG